MRPPAVRRSQAFAAFLAYLAFVVYGSLVPFELRPMDFEQAVAGFQHIQYLDLGAVSRADWIANIVLYVPLAFLGCTALLGMERGGLRAVAGLGLVGVFCIAVAIAVEFVQQWFAPRTVSLNDLIAESLGTLIGLALWALGRRRAAWLVASVAAGGRASVLAALIAYAALYLALSLFPYDFVVSAQELGSRLAEGNQGWLVASACGGPIRCGARLGLDALAIVPLGMLATLLRPGLRLARLFAAGVAVGLVLEPVQLLLVSGVGQGLSVPLRGLGMALGGLLGERLRLLGPRPLGRALTLAAPILALPYLAGLALVSGWLASPALSAAQALARLGEVRWIPFYYHYYTTESVAMASALAQLALYAPLGLFAWGLGARRGTARPGQGERAGGRGSWLAAALALSASLAIETGKLWFPPKHPDPTNLLAALAGALLAYALARWLERVLLGGEAMPARPTGWAAQPETARPEPARPPYPRAAAPPAARADERAPAPLPDQRIPTAPGSLSIPEPARPRPVPLGIALGIAVCIPLVAGILDFPLAWPLAAALLALYGLLLWLRPLAWLLVLPALLPSLDLSPLVGRLPLDAFDLCVLATLAVGYARLWGQRPLPWPNRLYPLALSLLWLSWGIALARALWPLLGTDWTLADGSHSPLEAWAVGKGMLWALLLVPLLRRVPEGLLEEARALFAQGVLAGLALVALAVLWERQVFVGIADFQSDFRATGTFASMATGGAYIEAFLAFAFPFVAVAVLRARAWPARGIGILLAGLGSYAIAVTFSRGGWAGLAAGLAVVLGGSLMRRDGQAGGRAVWIAAAALLGAVALVTLPALSGSFAQARLARSVQDLEIRVAHWQRALGLMAPGAGSVLLGEGFGQYPLDYLIGAGLDPGKRPPGTYAILHDGANPYLRLGAGESVFLDQRVAVAPGQTYRFSARVRLPAGAATLQVALCEKALLYSFQCARATLAPAPATATASGAGWQRLSADIASGRVGTGGHWPHPPVKLSLHNAGPAGAIDVDEASLKTRDGTELLANGDFSQGARRWLFVTDQDLAWHIHEQWVELYFAQGLLGLLAFLTLMAATGGALRPALGAGDPLALALAGGLAGVLAVGLLGSVLDTAPLSMLVYVAALMALTLVPPERLARRQRRRRRGRRKGDAEPFAATVEA